jgi:hypothetical protein
MDQLSSSSYYAAVITPELKGARDVHLDAEYDVEIPHFSGRSVLVVRASAEEVAPVHGIDFAIA